MSHPLTPPDRRSTKTLVALIAVVLAGAVAVLLATSAGSDSRRSSADALLETASAAVASANGQQPNQIVANLQASGHQAAVFDADGNSLAGDPLSLAAPTRAAALAGRTVLDVGKDHTVAAAGLGNGDVLVVQQPGPPTGYEEASVPWFWLVVVTMLVGLFGVVMGRLTASGDVPRRGAGGVPPAGVPTGTFPTPPPEPPRDPWVRPGSATWSTAAPIGSAAPPNTAPPPITAPPSTTAPPANTAPPAGTGIDELARKYLRLVDEASSPALYEEAVEALASAGFRLINPVGQKFDPTLHLAVGRRATSDPHAHNVIAETIRQGCYRDGRVVREAEVVVYRTDASGNP
jgi:hypothetical protein